jgi:hypothetical protein
MGTRAKGEGELLLLVAPAAALLPPALLLGLPVLR